MSSNYYHIEFMTISLNTQNIGSIKASTTEQSHTQSHQILKKNSNLTKTGLPFCAIGCGVLFVHIVRTYTVDIGGR